LLKVRDWVWDILERETGARMTHSFGRIGGMAAPPTANFKDDVLRVIPEVHKVVKETEIMLLRNRIFLDRMQGVGVLTKEQALSYGATGPMARSTGIAYDVRKDHPYLVYDRFDFDVPVGEDGDNWDRFMVRLEEIRQSVRSVSSSRRSSRCLTTAPSTSTTRASSIPTRTTCTRPSRRPSPISSS
jgi:NADH-quinone oxidoreductase subunit D